MYRRSWATPASRPPRSTPRLGRRKSRHRGARLGKFEICPTAQEGGGLMGYIEKIMGDQEQIVYRTHRHIIVLFGRVLGSFFAFLVFVAVGLALLLPPAGKEGDQVRFYVGLIALGSLVMPLYLIVSAWIRGLRGREFIKSIWRAVLAGVAILIVALLLMFSPGFKAVGWIAIVLAAIPLLDTLRIVADWLNEQFIITNRRVMEVRGIINKHVRDSALEKVNDVDLRQSLMGRLLGYGTVQIITGSDIGVNMFRRIANPVRFKREMLNAKEQFHASGKPPADEEKTIPELIAELDELRRKGVLTEEEFQAKKADLLARL
ncbi:MAG TPA: hypothetical protein ENJ31_01470 [Anaerolineae bacterium]|nr:hypothetical protein [Anaerolineae bacterium]